LLAYRELDDALGLTDIAWETLADARTGNNGRHALVGLLRQSVFGRLAGYEDVNDAERLRHDPAMRWIVGGKGLRAMQLRRARWAVSRRSGSRHLRTSLLLPICPASGSTLCTAAVPATLHSAKPVQSRLKSEFFTDDYALPAASLSCQNLVAEQPFRRLHPADQALRDRAVMRFAAGQQDGEKAPFSIGESSCCALRASGQQPACARLFSTCC
jgi:hypothetical protein